jgi:hypothetical protein
VDPPVPIPNTEVKRSSADDTALATEWENRSPPGFNLKVSLQVREEQTYKLSLSLNPLPEMVSLRPLPTSIPHLLGPG